MGLCCITTNGTLGATLIKTRRGDFGGTGDVHKRGGLKNVGLVSKT